MEIRRSGTAAAGIATVALGAGAVAVAMASRAPLSGATPVDARSAQAPTVALFMVLIAAGIAVLTALVIGVWLARRGKDNPYELEPTPMRVHWFVKVVAILLPLALVAALVSAAVIGSGHAHKTTGLALGGGFGSAPLSGAASSGNAGGFVLPAWLPWTALAIAGSAVATGLIAWWRREQRYSESASKSDATGAAVQAAIDAIDAEADPRRAVIAAYAAMQRTLGEHGIVRPPAEAPREYLRRVLAASRATDREASTLTALFEEARYSTHGIPEHVRDLALSALGVLRTRLQTEEPA